jgi:hypothetical protein
LLVVLLCSAQDAAGNQTANRPPNERIARHDVGNDNVQKDQVSDKDLASEETAREATKWIVWLANNHLPRHYDNTKHWGTQKTVLDGREFRRKV